MNNLEDIQDISPEDADETVEIIEPSVDNEFTSEIISSAMSKASTLDSLINLLTHDLKFDEFIRKILITLVREAKCEAGSILEVDYQNQTIFFRAVEGNSSDKLKDFVIPIGTGIVGHVIESRLPLVVQNIPENEDHLNIIAKAIGFEARNLIALPLLIRGRIYGVVELLNRIGEPNFSNTDIELLSYLSQTAAKAIEIRLMLAWSNRNQQTDGKKEIA